MNAPTLCLQCRIPENAETGAPVCNPLLCPKTIQTPRSGAHPVGKSGPPRIYIPQKPLDIGPGEDDEYEAAAVHGHGTYRPVSNRASKTVMARHGVRTCAPDA